MVTLSEEERKHFLEYRDNLLIEMERLDDSVQAGVLSEKEKDNILNETFGPSHWDILIQTNQLLHSPKKRIEYFFLPILLIAGLICSGILFTFAPGITGAAIEPVQITVEDYVNQEKPLLLPVTNSITIGSVTGEYLGEDTYAVYIEDAKKRTLLIQGTKTRTQCIGCGGTYHPPFMFTLEGSGSYYIDKLIFT